MEKVQEIKKSYESLLVLLKEQHDSELNYIISKIEESIELINKYPNDQMIFELNEIYLKINNARVGLSDYFIWRNDFDERLKANEKLDELKIRLNSYF
ncbi:hypothetical protein J2T13_001427 [Paenibacillus sp. DS2015]|uniref:hypothetical protein n=1 Tax=Paenibacillus sp. DS2015 TaxID=3373917 RepID=UPI003D20A732